MAVDVGTAMMGAAVISGLPASVAAWAAWKGHAATRGNGSGNVSEIVTRIEQRAIRADLRFDDHVANPDAHQQNGNPE